MANKLFYFSILMLSFLSCKTETKTESEHLEKSIEEKIDNLANRYHELNRFSGTIIVAKNNNIYNQSFGLADYENKIPFSTKTAFKIGEITTIITDEIIYKLVKEEKINLSDKLSKYLTEIESEVSINDILNKNADIDYNILGKLIEKISNKSYQENVEGYSNKLELDNTFFLKENPSIAVGYLYHNYRGKGLELQKSSIYDLENVFSSNGLKSTGSDLIKILKSNPRELEINGFLYNDGFSYSIKNDITNNTSIVILSNRRQPITSEILSGITTILEDNEYKLPLSRKPFEIKKTILKDFTGNYKLDKNVNFEVLVSNDSLFVILGPNKTHLIPQSSNQFYLQQMDASMRFLRDSTNLVNRVLLLNGFIDSEQTAYKIK